MPDIKQLMYSGRELTELMLKDQKVTSGHWQLNVTFGFKATNITVDDNDPTPGAAVIINSIGLQKMDQQTPMSIDASKLAKPKKRSARKVATK